MKKIISFLISVMIFKSILAFSPTGLYVLFQPNSQTSYLHFLQFDNNGQFVYYEFTISNIQSMSISLTDSVFGKWITHENNVCLYSNRYLASESNEIKNIYQVLPVKSLVGDSLILTIVDECTLKHPDLYRQFKCIDAIVPNILEKYLLKSIICDREFDAIIDDKSIPNNTNNK